MKFVVNYQNGWSAQTTVVKQGSGLVDLITYDGTTSSYERIGDYTDIQRKYNENSCWLIGSYPFDSTGTTPNHFGTTKGLNAWIAEVGMVGVNIKENQVENNYIVYPNPASSEIISITSNCNLINQKVELLSITGQLIFEDIIDTKSQYNINISNIKNGVYLLRVLSSNSKTYESKKIIIIK